MTTLQGSGLSSPPPVLRPPLAEATESADLFDYSLAGDYLTYVFGSVRRHKLLFAFVQFAMIGLAAEALKVLPKTYHVESKLLAQRNQVIAAIGNPGRNLPFDADAPTRAAAETILRTDNLVALARQTDLVVNFAQTRAPAQRLKDFLMSKVSRAETDEEKLNNVVGLLDQKLTVSTGEATVTISIDWPNATMAARLVEVAQQNFLEARHVSEISTISEAISILEGHAALLRGRVDQAADEVRKMIREAKPKRTTPTAAPSPAKEAAAAVVRRQETARLKVMLDEKRRTIADLEEFRTRRVAELQAKLAEQRTIYSDAHPAIIDLQQRIDTLEKQHSGQIESLRTEEEGLTEQLVRAGEQPGGASTSSRVSGEILSLERDTSKVNDPSFENAQGELHFAVAKYNSILDRIDAAQLELEAARAAFKYRYSVVRPAEVPRTPKSPNPVVLLAAGVVGGLLFALLVVVLRDVRAGRLVERWQVERALQLPILVEFKRG